MSDKIYNILHVIDKFSMDGINPSSCAYLIRDWHRYSDKSRFNVMACGLKKEEPAGAIFSKENIPIFFLGNGKYSPGNITGLMKLIENKKIDLVHLHGYSSANFGRVAARLKGIPNIVHEHAILKILPHQYVADFILRGLTDMAVGVSGAVKDFLIKGRHVPAKIVRVVYNGVNLENFTPSSPEKIEQLYKELSLDKNDIIVGNLTRLRVEKGNEYLVRAMPQVIAKHPNVKLVIAGEGPERPQIELLVKELSLQEYVKLPGFRRDITDLLSLFQIVAIPSLNEGFGLTMLEAMAMRKPVVASFVGGMIEIDGGKECALFARAGDSSGLADAIIRLIENPDLAARMGETGNLESKKFSIENNTRKLEELYTELLG